MSKKEDGQIKVVCTFPGSGIAKIFGTPQTNGVRPLVGVKKFDNYGQARQFAIDYEDNQR